MKYFFTKLFHELKKNFKKIILKSNLLFQKKYTTIYNAKIINDYMSEELPEYFSKKMNDNSPLFIGRIGGTDFEVVNTFFNSRGKFKNRKIFERSLNIVRNYNGYFDFEKKDMNFIKYLNILVEAYQSMDIISYSNPNIIEQFKNQVYLNKYYNFFNEILSCKVVFDYTFFEAVKPFLKSFQDWGRGKKILFISPFSKSIEYQFKRKDNLIKDYKFPDFKLLTYNTNITYNNDYDNEKNLNIFSKNWHEECDNIKHNLNSFDFDIAFLSCGSYAMPIGKYIKEKMNKKAVYLGGILNVIFNIYGKRYDTVFFNKIVNLKYQINAFENDNVQGIFGGQQFENESLNAYFGKKINSSDI